MTENLKAARFAEMRGYDDGMYQCVCARRDALKGGEE